MKNEAKQLSIDDLIEILEPNMGESPLVNFNKKRLREAIKNEKRIEYNKGIMWATEYMLSKGDK